MLKTIRIPLLVLAFFIGLAGVAVATPGVNFGPPTPLSSGTHTESVNYNTGEVKFQTKGAVDFVTVTITIGPSGSSGWHTHPGVVLVTVQSGALLHYEADCSATLQSAGSAFSEAAGEEPGLVRNASTTTPVVVYVTFIAPAGTTELRNDAPNPGCPQN